MKGIREAVDPERSLKMDQESKNIGQEADPSHTKSTRNIEEIIGPDQGMTSMREDTEMREEDLETDMTGREDLTQEKTERTNTTLEA